MSNNNYCIILAGGKGTKLWPMSSQEKPKQFYDLFSTGRTMLQMTYDRYSKLVPRENIYISTFIDYKELVKEQLQEIDEDRIICEPLQINTVPATALTLMHILGRNPEANIISAPADQLIYDSVAFEEQLNAALDFVDNTKNLIAIGIKPTRPATSYGYLQASEETIGPYMRLKSFSEKPNIEFARLFQESGEFYWSTGIFVWNIQSMLIAMEKDYPEIRKMASLVNQAIYTTDATRIIQEQYARIRFLSIDMLILERSDNVFIAPCTFGWADVGSWKNYYDLHQKDSSFNVTTNARALFYDSERNLVYTANEKIVVLQDLDDYIVVDTDRVLMICKKDDPAIVRRVVNDAKLRFGDDVV